MTYFRMPLLSHGIRPLAPAYMAMPLPGARRSPRHRHGAGLPSSAAAPRKASLTDRMGGSPSTIPVTAEVRLCPGLRRHGSQPVSGCFMPSAERAGSVFLPDSRRPGALCDHRSVPRGTAARWKRRYGVRLIVPRRGGWRAWGAVRADFERALADPADPAIATAEIASELRRGAELCPGDPRAHDPRHRCCRCAGHRVGRLPQRRPRRPRRLGGDRGHRGGPAGASVNPGRLSRCRTRLRCCLGDKFM